MKAQIAAMPPEVREPIEQASRAGRVCMQHVPSGELIGDERAPVDSPSALEAWLSEHPPG